MITLYLEVLQQMGKSWVLCQPPCKNFDRNDVLLFLGVTLVEKGLKFCCWPSLAVAVSNSSAEPTLWSFRTPERTQLPWKDLGVLELLLLMWFLFLISVLCPRLFWQKKENSEEIFWSWKIDIFTQKGPYFTYFSALAVFTPQSKLWSMRSGSSCN